MPAPTCLKRIFLALALMLFAATAARAEVMTKCVTLMDATSQTASTTGTVYALPDGDKDAINAKAFTAIAEATNNSGTTPTLDIKIQTCESKTTSTCHDSPAVFDRCTTGSCHGGDAWQAIDFSKDSVNVFPFFRAVTTLAGTSPNYNVKVRICYR